MNAPAAAGSAPAPRSLREEAEGQLWLTMGLLVALTVFTVLGRVLLEPPQPVPGEQFPQGTAVSHTALPLDALEAARFDAAILGSPG